MRAVLRSCRCSDWFVLYQLTGNYQSATARQVVRHLATALAPRHGHARHSSSETRRGAGLEEARRRKEQQLYSEEEEIYSRPCPP